MHFRCFDLRAELEKDNVNYRHVGSACYCRLRARELLLDRDGEGVVIEENMMLNANGDVCGEFCGVSKADPTPSPPLTSTVNTDSMPRTPRFLSYLDSL